MPVTMHYPPDVEAQSCAGPISQASTRVNDNSVSPRKATVYGAVVIQGLDESCSLINIQIDNTDKDEQFWKRVREEVCAKPCTGHTEAFVSKMFTRTVVGTATINQVGTIVNQGSL